MTDELLAVLALDLDDPELLYERCYTRDCRADSPAAHEPGDLIAANPCRERWDDTWSVEQPLDEGRVLARRGGASRPFYPGQYITLRGPGPEPREGEPLRVFQAAGTPDIQSGFYFMFGETVSEFDEFEDLLRVYWNLSADGAALLVAELGREFNRFGVPFRFKCGQRPAIYQRRDSAVLYFHRLYYPIAAQLVERIHARLAAHLRDGVPLFTRELARGLALAEDPGQSFGRSRCALLAEAMTATRGRPAERLDALRRCFEARGLSLDQPWRNAASAALYPYPFRV